MTYKLITVK